MRKLLIIDDESSIRFTIEDVLASDDLEVAGAETAEEGVRLAGELLPDLILLDIKLGKHSGMEVFAELRRVSPKSLLVFITGHGNADTAIEAMKLGAYDYLVKPLDADQLQQVVEQAFDISRLMRVPAILEEATGREDRPDLLIGCGAAMQAVCKQIGRVAPQDVNVLILGESGTGKELVARAIYHHSRRSQAPFLAINCAAIPETLLESELFGHERGAFTGADRRRIGKFEQCHGGTLLLDEIGDMALSTQAKILRLLQEGRFERIGGSETLSCRRPRHRRHEPGPGSDDRTGTVPQGPLLSLAGRDDPPAAAARTVGGHRGAGPLFSVSLQSPDSALPCSPFLPQALELMERYDWPGNVRELQSVVREALIVSAGPTLLPDFLPLDVRRSATEETHSGVDETHEADVDWQALPRRIDSWLGEHQQNIYRRAAAFRAADHRPRDARGRPEPGPRGHDPGFEPGHPAGQAPRAQHADRPHRRLGQSGRVRLAGARGKRPARGGTVCRGPAIATGRCSPLRPVLPSHRLSDRAIVARTFVGTGHRGEPHFFSRYGTNEEAAGQILNFEPIHMPPGTDPFRQAPVGAAWCE